MPKSKTQIRVRPLEVKDFSFVRELAAQQPNFTIPPPYVLWLLMKIKGDVCLIAEDEVQVPVGYILAVPISNPVDSLHVWQLACLSGSRNTDTSTALLTSLKQSPDFRRVKHLVFSACPDSAPFRAIQRDALRIFRARPNFVSVLPTIVAPNESEFQVVLR